MKKRNLTARSKALGNATRRRSLLKKLNRKLQMRRQDFQIQLECEQLAKAS